ncbi:alpha-1,2-fucosyltransferase [Pedobacter frigidisoli]|uniref:alpha-1,2-fucosyltransferase n=1 Tax=Pedobacter frigidisoli TaxID=2530455 RepID=UPI00292E68BE|nr:alpha-1,2-fucosyltransferase [Pedobacter frigidisoli]
MVVVKLKGGLGNQMFQYAVGKRLAKNSKLLFDTDFYSINSISNEYFTARKFSLFIFKNIKIKIAKGLIKYLVKEAILPKTRKFIQSDENELIDLKKLNFSNAYLDGYFQNETYFKGIREQLLIDFEFPEVQESNIILYNKILADNSSVAIHVRRGDYLKPMVESFHGVLSITYYQQAIEKIKTSIKQPHFYIFSDDPDWCRKEFQSLKIHFTVVSNSQSMDWEDMKMMSKCKHNIIANSSYSWWAAWLNINEDKMIIAPNNWFLSAPIEIIPDKWIKI